MVGATGGAGMSIIEWLKRLFGFGPAKPGSPEWRRSELAKHEQTLISLQTSQRDIRDERGRVAARLEAEEQRVAAGGLTTEAREDALSNVRRFRERLAGLRTRLRQIDEDIELATRVMERLRLLGTTERPSEADLDELTSLLNDEDRVRRGTAAAEQEQGEQQQRLHAPADRERELANDELERDILQKHAPPSPERHTESE